MYGLLESITALLWALFDVRAKTNKRNQLPQFVESGYVVLARKLDLQMLIFLCSYIPKYGDHPT